MPKKDSGPTICDGCGAERTDIKRARIAGMRYCTACAKRREDDPILTVQGRSMTFSELKTQAKKDKELSAALKGDAVKDQIEAAKGK